MSHVFEDKTFTRFVYCDNCKQLLWGLKKQGVECKECGYICHRKCQLSASVCSSANLNEFLNDSSHPDSLAENYLRQLSHKVGSDRSSIISSTATLKKSKQQHINVNKSNVYNSTLDHIKAIAASDKLHNILAEAALAEQQIPVNAYLANQAALNPQITAKNFTRFVSRCGPVFAFRDELLLLLSWKNRTDTFVSLIIYCIICLYPKLLFFIPQLLLLYFIVVSYPKSKTNKVSSFNTMDNKKETFKDYNNNAIDIKSATHSHTDNEKPILLKEEEEEEEGKDAAAAAAYKKKQDIPPLFSFNFSTLFQPASDESPEYLRNLQNLQNTMGEFSDIYDWIVEKSDYFNWSSETKTIRILQLILFQSFVFGFVLYCVPINYLFLFFGLIVYGLNTRFAKYVIKETKPYMIQFGKKNAKALMDWYIELEDQLEQQELLKEISVFENQKWWAMRGYLHEMAKDERSSWSDFTGTVYMPIITEIPPPRGYQWKESSEWVLDTTGPWVDTYLGIEVRL
ncbi:integral peroxisomal membrane peroxin-domain-containing protein [Cokeromyces recurvatus]|uniref:integral peroxisomal membrane peroxin-domain-containing protein n=1 Tax=Cokeromyces recurvatus TaxID=90255 RepID=UPI002220D970|nr:integral peroxisomal membrane peroxin-domain-containing protein [Cokeromyces recurvatus]KAI7907199.1 integral peroxisomal membrane peroxin-domain-containing protein [Cokeromyces recurvatus]